MDASLPCRLRIKESFHTLPPKEKRIAEFVLQSPEAVIHMSMEELARSCGVSLSAIVRLAKNLNGMIKALEEKNDGMFDY